MVNATVIDFQIDQVLSSFYQLHGVLQQEIYLIAVVREI